MPRVACDPTVSLEKEQLILKITCALKSTFFKGVS